MIARIATGVIFVAHGWQKWQGGQSVTSQDFRDMGIPMPELTAGYTTLVEVVGGVLLILGLLVRPVALLLLLAMVGAIAFVHGGKGVMVENGGWELTGALGALCLLFLALGGGRIGVDGIFARMFRRRSERRVAAGEEPVVYPPGAYVPGGTAAGGTAVGDDTTAGATTHGRRPDVPRQPAAPTSRRLDDEDMREIDALVADEPPQHHKPPNR
ncbi:hypothetical protein GCM10022224_072880 [Nonomuraea antimicrobica]|uniref:Oxidoreductase n=1 Tax=Nonomuraea antimicrobica TaxID=561173 RepID=A0ABP7CY07_9ACTN